MNNNYIEVLQEVAIYQKVAAVVVPTIIATVGYYGLKEEQMQIRKMEILHKLEQERKRINQTYNFTVAEMDKREFKSGQLGEYNFIVE